MGKVKTAITEKTLKKGDNAVLYVTTCSDVDTSLKHSRRLLECCVIGKIDSYDLNEVDDRYIIRCSERLREEPVRNGAFPDEALVSFNSPFLMKWEEFNSMMESSEKLNRWLSEVSDILSGKRVPAHLKNWQKETSRIMAKLGIDADEAISDIVDDFLPENGKEVICFPR